MLDIKLIGGRIRDLRREHGLTQTELADSLRVSFQAVSNWERGVAPPELENIIRIAEIFGVTVDSLLRPSGEALFLGIDGGGTKTEFALVNSAGEVKRLLLRGGSNPNDIGFSAAEEIIASGIKEILIEYPSVKAIFAGIAGTATGDHAARMTASLKKRYTGIDISVKSDAMNLFGIDDRADMVVISGTGSVVFAKSGEGYSRLGGWGYLLDRAGSAYDIGREVIRLALFKEDIRKPCSLIRDKLLKQFGTDTVWEQVDEIYKRGKPYIASLSSIAFEAYLEGDSEAEMIIDESAEGLAELLDIGVRVHNAKPRALASGGLFEHYPDIMTEHIKRYTDVELILPELPPVYGAARTALGMTGREMSDTFCESFKRTYRSKKR